MSNLDQVKFIFTEKLLNNSVAGIERVECEDKKLGNNVSDFFLFYSNCADSKLVLFSISFEIISIRLNPVKLSGNA